MIVVFLMTKETSPCTTLVNLLNVPLPSISLRRLETLFHLIDQKREKKLFFFHLQSPCP